MNTKKNIIIALIGIFIYIIASLSMIMILGTEDILVFFIKSQGTIGLLIYFLGVLWKLQKSRGKIKIFEKILILFISVNLILRTICLLAILHNSGNFGTYQLSMLIEFIFQLIFAIFIYEIMRKKINFISNKILVACEICYLVLSLIIGIVDGYYVVFSILKIIIEGVLYLSILKYFYNYYNELKNIRTSNEDNMRCIKCNAEISALKFIINDGICDECESQKNKKKINSNKGVTKMKNWRMICIGVAVIFCILSCICLWKGFDKILNYRNSDTYTYNNVNAYVGGDAYNYIINAGYFAGFVSLGGCLLIISAIFMTTAIKLKQKQI